MIGGERKIIPDAGPGLLYDLENDVYYTQAPTTASPTYKDFHPESDFDIPFYFADNYVRGFEEVLKRIHGEDLTSYEHAITIYCYADIEDDTKKWIRMDERDDYTVDYDDTITYDVASSYCAARFEVAYDG